MFNVGLTPRPRRILLVDAPPINIQVLYQVFHHDHPVLMATNGQQALRIARTRHPDLVLLDVEVPGMDGHDVCRRRLAGTLRETPRRPGQPTAARAYITAPSCQGTNSFCP